MSQYLLLIRDENIEAPVDPAAQQEMFVRFVRWTEDLQKRGVLQAVEKLEVGGKTVHKKKGALTVDGPFVETKEQVLGYFLIEAPDWDAAVEVAGSCPGLDTGGTLEVREIGKFPKPGS